MNEFYKRVGLKLKSLLNARKLTPKSHYVSVSVFGQMTVRPQIIVTLAAPGGAMTLAAYKADEAGNARATIYAQDVARLSGFPLIDTRGETAARGEFRK